MSGKNFYGVFYIIPLTAFLYYAATHSIAELAALVAAALTHEAGHIAVLRLFGGGGAAVRLSPFGLIINTDMRGFGYLRMCAVFLAGAAANIAAALAVRPFVDAGAFFGRYYYACIFCGLVNLLPVATLDGGRALSAILMKIFGYDTARAVSGIVSTAVSLLLWSAATYAVLRYGGSVYSVLFSLYLFILGFGGARNYD